MPSDGNGSISKIVASISILILLGTGMYLTLEVGRRTRIESKLKEEKLRSESLLAEKLSFEKEILNLKSDIKDISRRNDELGGTLNSTSEKLRVLEHKLGTAKKESESVGQLKKQRQQLKAIQQDLEEQITNHEEELRQLGSTHEDFTLMVASLQDQNKALTAELNALRMALIEDVLIESQKKNNRLTVKAWQTKKLFIEVDVPSAAIALNLKITDPRGTELTPATDEIAMRVIKSEPQKMKAFYIPGSTQAENQQSLKRVAMIYTPKKKLVPGLYKVTIRNEAIYMGSLQIKLR